MKTKNKTIWKYIIKPVYDSILQIPKGADILAVQLQDGIVCIWVLVDPQAEKENRKFSLIGTGHIIITDNGTYIATLQFEKTFGHFNQVYHLFEFPS